MEADALRAGLWAKNQEKAMSLLHRSTLPDPVIFVVDPADVLGVSTLVTCEKGGPIFIMSRLEASEALRDLLPKVSAFLRDPIPDGFVCVVVASYGGFTARTVDSSPPVEMTVL